MKRRVRYYLLFMSVFTVLYSNRRSMSMMKLTTLLKVVPKCLCLWLPRLNSITHMNGLIT